MLKTFLKYNQVIGMHRKSVMIILTLTFFSSISEAFGIGIFYPIFQYIQSDGNLSLLAADSVALMFKKQTVIVNSHPIICIYSWVNGITAPKRLFWDNGNGKELSLTEHLDNQDASQYQEKGIIAVDLTPDEVKFTVKEMIDRLNGMPLTNKQIQSEKKFWDILERHESYGKYHGVRDERASFGTSFLCNNPEFLS
jgi:hypothetical protein